MIAKEFLSNNISLKKNIKGLTSEIFKFVIDNNYDIFTSNYEMKLDISNSFYNKHIKNSKEDFIVDFKNVDFYDNNLYNTTESKELANLQKTLFNFKLAIVDVMRQNGALSAVKMSTTSASPPLTRKMGNNKLDIKPTGRDYGLLFR